MSDIGYPEGIVERELREHGVYASNTVGYSMSPLLRHHKDVVIIEPPSGILKKYDVALYPDGKGNYILHRVIAVRDGEYIIRGDNTFVKEHVPHSAVVGVLVAYNRGGKRHDCKELGYRMYSRFWCFIYPLRSLWRKVKFALARLKKKLFGKRKRDS